MGEIVSDHFGRRIEEIFVREGERGHKKELYDRANRELVEDWSRLCRHLDDDELIHPPARHWCYGNGGGTAWGGMIPMPERSGCPWAGRSFPPAFSHGIETPDRQNIWHRYDRSERRRDT